MTYGEAKYSVVNNPAAPQKVLASTMSVGELAEVLNGDNDGSIILRTFAGWVSLNSPNSTWADAPHLYIRRLARGEQVTLTVL